MKVCPQCGENYRPFVDFCFADGEVLAMEAAEVVDPVADAFDAPPPPKMLQGSQGGGYTRSATPVPRARRPGRTLVRNDGGGVYTPPSQPTPAVPDEVIAAPPPPPSPEASIEAWDEEELEAFEEIPSATPLPAPQPEPILSAATAPPAPTATTPAPVEPERMPYAAAAPASHIEEDEEDDDVGGLGMWAIAAVAVIGIGAVAVSGVAAIVTMMQTPEDPTTTVSLPEPIVLPVPKVEPRPATEPLAVGVVPEPMLDPEPVVEPEPVVDPEPAVAPEPVVDPEPVPAVPQPVVPVAETAPVPVVAPVPEPPRKLANVTFSSTPDRARIFLDGAPIVGTTRFTVPDVPFGLHELRLEKDGYQPHVQQINVQTSALTLGTVRLKPLTNEAVAPTPEPEPPAIEPVQVMFFYIDEGDIPAAQTISVGGRVMGQTGSIQPGPVTVTVTDTEGTVTSFNCTVNPSSSLQRIQLWPATGACKIL